MPILAQKNEYVLPLTYQCNIQCPYCAIKNSHDFRTNITKEDIFSRISLIKNNSIVTLTGGEPGLIEKIDIEEYILALKIKNCKLYLETNGLFIKKYPELLENFEEILYHCSIDMKCVHDLKYFSPKFRYLLIVNDDNIKNLLAFIYYHNNIKFDIIECTYPYEKTGPILSKENKNFIMTHCVKHMTEDSIKRLIHEKEFDFITWLM